MDNKPLFQSIAEIIANSIDLKLISFEGKGTFKETYKAKHTDGTFVALKIADPNRILLSRTKREIKALKSCNIKYIGKLYHFGSFKINTDQKYFFTVEEFLNDGTLSKRLSSGSIGIKRIVNYGIILTKAISHLWEKKLVHRDIKPDNIMFRKGEDIPVLVDLGLVRDLKEYSLTPTWQIPGPGTPLFSAPEQLNNEKFLIDWRTDQFSLGLVLGLALTGKHPFHLPERNINEIVEAMANREICSEKFIASVESYGIIELKKMLEPWSLKRFKNTTDLINYFQKFK